MNPKEYKILCIMGKAGAGKDTIMGKILNLFPEKFVPVVSFTSRPKRENEIDGINYHFISKSNFIEKIKNNSMIEWTCFNNWYYGTAQESFSKDKINICVCNPEGVRHFKKLGFDIMPIYIDVKDKTRLLRQLEREDNPNVAEIIRRYSADEKDFENLEYEFKFENEDGTNLTELADYIVYQFADWANLDN